MAKTRVAVVFGGRSGEHEISLASARSVLTAIDRDRYDVVPMAITREGRWITGRDSLRLLGGDNREAPEVPPAKSGHLVTMAQSLVLSSAEGEDAVDVVFPVVHGTFGEDGTLQGLLEMAGLPYVGAGVLASALGMDKALMKTVFRAHGLPTPDFVSFRNAEWRRGHDGLIDQIRTEIGYPCFVKPANMGSSVGVSKAHSLDELVAAVELALEYDRKVIVEKAITAREIECSVLGNDDPIASVVGEIVPSNEFYDYQAKYASDETELLIPAPLSAAQVAQVQQMAVKAFKVLDCEGMARVDFFLDRCSSEIYVNEVNTIPGFTAVSMYPKLWAASGLPYPELIDRLISLAIERHEQRKRLKTSVE